MHLRRLVVSLILVLAAAGAFAQQTGSISGRVLATDGSALPGVTVEGRSNQLPQPRVTTTDANGEYRLPALIPGSYTLTFTLAGMQTVTRNATVLLGQTTTADVKLGVQGVSESITVTAQAGLVEKSSTALQSGLSQQQIATLPIVQNYGDLQKLVPGVMYTQDTFRGPSAGASGQDNVYLFDGANITMPLFGILNTQPNTNDIAQVNVIRGGAKAVDFDRAGGFQIDTVSKSGTNKFTGMLGYQLLNHGFVAKQVGSQNLVYNNDQNWTTVNVGGPILPNHLFFYGSYYRPYATRASASNLYGPLPQYKLTTNEEFGKLTFTPTESWLINGSYRHNTTDQTTSAFGSAQAGSEGSGSKTALDLGNLEGSWIISPRAYATFKLTDFRSPGNGGAVNFVNGVNASTDLGTHLDLNNLGSIGELIVPTLTAGNDAQNAFVLPFINKYGFICPPSGSALSSKCTPGTLTGGGTVGFYQFAQDNDNFFRKAGQVGYNLTFGTAMTHDFHVGYQRYNDSEDRFQTANGWGLISIPAGVGNTSLCPTGTACAGQPFFFQATFPQRTLGLGVPSIHSEFHSQNVEFNDTMHWQNWSFNLGVLDSQDILYGQGLAKADNVAGFIASPGTKYKMHTFNWGDMIQPRLSATWAYNGNDTVFASLARYMPPANSDARAASWDRNLVQTINAYFDASGNLIGFQPNGSSSGKWFESGIRHPEIKEFMIGTARQLTNSVSARVYGRARKGDHYMEDTNNNSRFFNAPPGVPQQLFIPNLGNSATAGTIRNAIAGGCNGSSSCSGSSYVIANLDGAFTKYYEATAETEWRGTHATLHGSYTWSHYYGNFDQDNSSFSFANDAAIFIGSSNIGDGPGRQLWDFKYGDLRGDRRNQVKLYGTYMLPWNASVGAFGVFQSGQPYQLESVLPYRPQTGSASDTARYAEPAGARKSPSQTDLDLDYTQNIGIPFRGANLQLAFDVFNVMNRQTGYNFETRIGTLGIKQIAGTSTPYTGATVPIPSSISDDVLFTQVGKPANFSRANYAVAAPIANSFLAPRRFQVAARFIF
jgi:hypothetical protein